MNTQTPSLKHQISELFKSIESEFDEKRIEQKVRELVSTLVSSRGKNVCAYPSCYKHLDVKAMRFSYDMHMVAKITEIGTAFHQDLQSEFVRNFLALAIEYFNLLLVTTKREKNKIHKRMSDLRIKIFATDIQDQLWNPSSALMELHHLAINVLSNAFILAMK